MCTIAKADADIYLEFSVRCNPAVRNSPLKTKGKALFL